MAYKSTEQLQRELAQLRAQREVDIDFERRNKERKVLQGQVRELKYRRVIGVGRSIKGGAVRLTNRVTPTIKRFGQRVVQAQAPSKAKKIVKSNQVKKPYNPFGDIRFGLN